MNRDFLPGVLERKDLPSWFITMADSRSKGIVEYIVWDHKDKDMIHADYFINGEFLETKSFNIKVKGKL
jgi:hypothetical protein